MKDYRRCHRFYAHGKDVVVQPGFIESDHYDDLVQLLSRYGFDVTSIDGAEPFRIDRFLTGRCGQVDMMSEIGELLGSSSKQHAISEKCYRAYPRTVDFREILETCKRFADFIIANRDSIITLLVRYETHSVAKDEIERTLDLFQNIDENEPYFRRRIGNTLAILPRNQPLYALSCFALVPSLFSSSTHALFPSAMKCIAPIKDVLRIDQFFPNVRFPTDRQTVIRELSQLRYCKDSGLWFPNVDAVIFTGSPENAKKVQSHFDDSVLFIGNGAGHNPVVIGPNANLDKATEAVLELQLYNQGQDCASPSSILVHHDVHDAFVEKLNAAVSEVKIGPYSDPDTLIGPITKPEDLDRILKTLLVNREWISEYSGARMDVACKTVEPTLVVKPLKQGANYQEQLAPVFFIQKYDCDEELSLYFETPRYQMNAMYVTLYGTSDYVRNLSNARSASGKVIHDEDTIIVNKHLHQKGVERGVEPYGGYGRGASWISIHGMTEAKPTLPQRDIFQKLVLPSLLNEEIRKVRQTQNQQLMEH